MADLQPKSVGDILLQVADNLGNDPWYSQQDILDSIQDAYNKFVALLCPIEKSTFIPQLSSPYYRFDSIPDFMYISGIFNPAVNYWLDGISYKQMKGMYQTYLAVGQPRWLHVTDMRRALIWPFQPTASGVLYVVYKAKAPVIDLDHIPILPYSIAAPLLEYSATSDLYAQRREFSKAMLWKDKIFKTGTGKSLYNQASAEIKNLARMDRELVLEPYRWIFHGGSFVAANWIDNEVPAGTVDGSNAAFTLAGIPNPSGSLLLMKNGQVMYSGVAYNISGSTVTFTTDYIPQTGDLLRAWYQVA